MCTVSVLSCVISLCLGVIGAPSLSLPFTQTDRLQVKVSKYLILNQNQNLTEKSWVQCFEDAEKTPACINKWAGFCYWPIWSKEWWFWTVLPVRVVWGNTNEGTDSDLSVLVLPRYLSIILPSSLSLPPPSSGSNTSCSGLCNKNASFVPFKKINKKRINSAKRTSN